MLEEQGRKRSSATKKNSLPTDRQRDLFIWVVPLLPMLCRCCRPSVDIDSYCCTYFHHKNSTKTRIQNRRRSTICILWIYECEDCTRLFLRNKTSTRTIRQYERKKSERTGVWAYGTICRLVSTANDSTGLSSLSSIRSRTSKWSETTTKEKKRIEKKSICIYYYFYFHWKYFQRI